MVMISSIEEVAQVVLQVHHQHRLRGWTLSAELGDSLLLGGGAALELRLDGDMRVDGVHVPGTSDVGVVSQHRALACEGPNRLAAASRSLRHCSTAHQFFSLFNAKPAQSSRICGVPCERWSARIDHSVTDAAAIVKQRCGAVTAPLDAQRVHHPNAHGQHVDMSRMSRQRAFALSCARLRPE